ncbi:fatty acid desaturase family protein [Sciscionella marina]|uniref:fatty acid desaturase family protein n=1 Tax=Sciscionella marina TaxID=508770 RepID=UPI0003618E9D|nr:acyl-CoA desaturase [Sciscionella marina]
MTTETLSPPAEERETGSDFAKLSRRIAAKGLFDRRPGYYTLRIGSTAALYLGGIAAFFLLGDSWWQVGIAAFFALMYAQVALVSHDIAHRQVFRKRKLSQLAGWIAGNLGIGMSYGSWMDKHTRHHANPNHEELDPDVEPDIIVWSKDQARASKGLPRFVGRYQAFIFFPLLTLEGINLHLSGFRALRSSPMKHKWLEGLLLSVHVLGYLAALFLVLSPEKAIVFLVVHQCLWGVYMGSVFAPGHKGMPTLKEGEKLDYLRRQVLTTRNVRGGWFVDNAMGGLNYQIEHHLFPNMAAINLPRAQVVVREYCAELGLPYYETGLLASYGETLRHLHSAGEPIRAGS